MHTMRKHIKKTMCTITEVLAFKKEKKLAEVHNQANFVPGGFTTHTLHRGIRQSSNTIIVMLSSKKHSPYPLWRTRIACRWCCWSVDDPHDAIDCSIWRDSDYRNSEPMKPFSTWIILQKPETPNPLKKMRYNLTETAETWAENCFR